MVRSFLVTTFRGHSRNFRHFGQISQFLLFLPLSDLVFILEFALVAGGTVSQGFMLTVSVLTCGSQFWDLVIDAALLAHVIEKHVSLGVWTQRF